MGLLPLLSVSRDWAIDGIFDWTRFGAADGDAARRVSTNGFLLTPALAGAAIQYTVRERCRAP